MPQTPAAFFDETAYSLLWFYVVTTVTIVTS